MVPRNENSLQMRWFRGHIRLNSWFALLALTVNFALSFGHVHVLGGHDSERGAIVEVLTVSDHGKAQGHSNESHPDYLCPICVANAALANAWLSTPPAVVLQFDAAVVDRITTPVRLAVSPHRAPFQSRGPPVS